MKYLSRLEMAKPIVTDQSFTENDLLDKVFDGKAIHKDSQGNLLYDQLYLVEDQVNKLFPESMSPAAKYDFLWWVMMTPHNYRSAKMKDFITQTISLGGTPMTSTDGGYHDLTVAYQRLFPKSALVSPEFTAAQTMPGQEVVYMDPEVVIAISKQINPNRTGLAGPYKTLSSNFNSAIAAMRYLNKKNMADFVDEWGIAEADARDLTLDHVVFNMMLYAKDSVVPKPAPADSFTENNFMMHTNRDFAVYFGFPRDYHLLRPQFADMVQQAMVDAENGVYRFVNLDTVAHGTTNDFIVSYGTIGAFYPVNISSTRGPYFYMPYFNPPTYMNSQTIEVLTNFLNDPTNVPERYRGDAVRLLEATRQYNQYIQAASIPMANLSDAEIANMYAVLVWAYTYIHVSRGLTKNGQYVQESKEQRTQRALKQGEIFKYYYEKLTPGAQQVFSNFAILDLKGNPSSQLPDGIRNYGDLARAMNICWGYKGEQLYFLARGLLDGFTRNTGQSADTIANLIMRRNDTKGKIDGHLYPLTADVEYSNLVRPS